MYVKTVRFSKVVKKSGAPRTYLVLVDPGKDRTLQAAVNAQRVMTVAQETVATKTDHCRLLFHPGPRRVGCLVRLANAKSVGSFIKAAKRGRISDREPSLRPSG